jgi:copper chaperone NosL
MNKKISYYFIAIFLTLILITSCSMEPEPIRYGHDQCSFCKMNIVVKSHSAQLVTPKGRQMKYDAVECLIWNVNQSPELKGGILLVADFYAPGTMLPAEQSFYIISPTVKSPMGANLSAVKDHEAAKKFVEEYDGEIFVWNEILEEVE